MLATARVALSPTVLATARAVLAADLSTYEPEGLLAEPPGTLLLLLLPTYEGGMPPEGATWFCR